MEMCRACLVTEQDMVPLDEFCVESYNLLTNLQIKMGDSMPQCFCQNCFNMVKVFTDFREKAITSETSLQDIIQNIVKPGDSHIGSKYVDGLIKLEIDLPEDDDCIDCESLHDEGFSTEVYANGSCENDVDMKCQLLQCGLCQGDFIDNLSFLDHLKLHKRGGTCRLCFQKVKLDNLYSHTLTHLQPIPKLENDLDSKPKIKLEPIDNDCLATSAVSAPAKVKIKPRKIKRPTKVKRKSKLSRNDAVEFFLACGLCKMSFDCKELLNKHLESHKTNGIGTCKLCDETFNGWPQLFAHRMTHVPQKQKRCHLCKYRKYSIAAMEFHYKMVHYDGEDKTIACRHCHLTFLTPRKLTRHMFYSHSEKKYICDYCSKSHRTKQSLRSHISKHESARPHVCDECGFATKRRIGLVNHKRWKHDPRSMSCKLCCTVFVDTEKFEKHNCNPTSVVCPECGKEFPAKRALSRHLKTHAAEAAHKCPRCDAAYRSRSALKVHLDQHDGNRTQRCQYCPATFYSPSVLIKHRRIHTGEKPYVCKICHKGFTGNNNLKIHMKIHGEHLVVKKDTEILVK